MIVISASVRVGNVELVYIVPARLQNPKVIRVEVYFVEVWIKRKMNTPIRTSRIKSMSVLVNSVPRLLIQGNEDEKRDTEPSSGIVLRIVNSIRSKIPSDYFQFLILFIASRIVLAFIGVVSRKVLEPYHTKPDYWLFSKHKWLDIWGAWDTGWYLNVAQHGYSTILNPALGQSNIGFFPLYPIMIWLAGKLSGDLYTGSLIVSNVSFLVGAFFLYKLVEQKYDSSSARWCLLFALLAPVGFIFSAALSESLYFLLVILCFYFSYKRNWLLAGTAGFFAALARPQGLFLVLPLGIDFLVEFYRRNQKLFWQIFFLALIPAGTFAFAYYTYLLTGDWQAYVHSKQQGWHVATMMPWVALKIGLHSNEYRVYINSVFTVVVLILFLVQVYKLPFSWTVFSLIQIVFPLRYGDANIVSMFRYALPVFPLYVILARSGLSEQVKTFLLLLLAMVQSLFMISFANGFDFII